MNFLNIYFVYSHPYKSWAAQLLEHVLSIAISVCFAAGCCLPYIFSHRWGATLVYLPVCFAIIHTGYSVVMYVSSDDTPKGRYISASFVSVAQTITLLVRIILGVLLLELAKNY